MDDFGLLCFVGFLWFGVIVFFMGIYPRMMYPEIKTPVEDSARKQYKSEKSKQEKRWEENAR